MSHPWPVELLQDHLLHMYLAEITMCVMIVSKYSLSKTLQYLQFSFVHQEITKVVGQHTVVRMLTTHITPIPPQLKIVLMLKLNPVKEVRYGRVYLCGG